MTLRVKVALIVILLSLLQWATVVRATPRLPWISQGSFKPDLAAREPSRTRSALERRQSGGETCDDPFDICGPGECFDPSAPTCCTTVTPGSRRRSGIPTEFTGDILDPIHAVRFLLSDQGTYTHDNGTIIRDVKYEAGRRRALVRHAKRGLLTRVAEASLRSLGAFAQTLAATQMTRLMMDHVMQPNTLFVFSPQTAVDQSEWPEIARLLLQEEWDALTIGAVRVERSMAEFVHAVFEGRENPID